MIFWSQGEHSWEITPSSPFFNIYPWLTTVRNRMQWSTNLWSALVTPFLHSYITLHYWTGSQNYCKDPLQLRETEC